jgi:hypothetical protein
MKVSRPSHQIKLTAAVAVSRVFLVSAGLLLGGAGCAPVVAQAPFAYRGDTVEPGDLLGPFDGRVVDTLSGKPIGGAIVQVSWAFETGRGLVAPAGGVVSTVATDNDGQYVIERLASVPGTRSRVTGVTLTVYQRGYVAYRSDRVFDGTRARSDFCQHLNVAKLERWNPALSHVQHVRFVGGAGTLKRALGSELVEASLELTAGPSTTRTPTTSTTAALLDIGGLLSADELKAVTGFGGKFAIERLADLPTTPNYDSRHFRAVDKLETFDAALRVWKLSPAAAQARYEQLLKDIPHAESRDEVGDRSLRGFDGRIAAVAALDLAHGVLVELTCGLDQCRDADQAAALLRRVLGRADRLGGPVAPSPEEKSATEKPSEQPSQPEPAPQEDNQFKLRPPELKR